MEFGCGFRDQKKDFHGVAKLFMTALGSNHSTVKDAESTDISSLRNVLEWSVFLVKHE